MKSVIASIFVLALCLTHLAAQNNIAETDAEKAQRMEWFKDAKLGIFIHYGIYSVNGIDESWSFFNGYINYQDYMKQLEGFTAANYNANKWAEIFKNSGAKYAVLTSKHHDGVALWDTKTDHYSTVEHTPSKKDIVTPFVNALRENDLKVGLYYSLIDWSYPDYPAFLRNERRYENDPLRWGKFRDFYFAQMDEISTQFKPDLLWFDGDWEHSAEEWQSHKLRTKLLADNPNVIINNRLTDAGDYETPEQGVPVTKPDNTYWELCQTMNNSWGYQYNDHKYKSKEQMIRIFAECIGMGGNLLLDIGPKEDGSIPEPQLKILEEFGRWTSKHAEAVYATKAGLPKECFYGPTALSKDEKTVFLYFPHTPKESIAVKGLTSKLRQVRLVGSNQSLEYQNEDGILNIAIADKDMDETMTVVAVDLEEPLAIETVDKSLQDIQMEKLLQDDAWKTKHKIALADMEKGLPSGHFYGSTALSKDKTILYLILEGKTNGPLMIKGLKNDIHRIWVVGNGTKLKHEVIGKLYWNDIPGIAYIDLPDEALDSKATIVAILLDGPIELYREKGTKIESN